MSKYIIKNGSKLNVTEIDSISNKLPKGTYVLEYNAMLNQVSLRQVDDFKLPKKIYGDQTIVNRIIQVYRNKDRNVGLLLYGLKGAGKSLCMRRIAKELDQPVIIMTGSYGDGNTAVMNFLSDSTIGDCTILIDEFEKKFDPMDDFPLTLLDGIMSTHHFFILTANDFTLNPNLQNRPGRIYYNIAYSGLDSDVIREVATDLLIDKTKISELVEICEEIPSISFDMLMSIINDVNLFNDKSIKDTVKWFGFRQESQYVTVYQIINGVKSDKPIVDCSFVSDASRFSLWLNGFKLYSGDAEQSRETRVDFVKADMKKKAKNIYYYKTSFLPDEFFEDNVNKTQIKQALQKKGVVFEKGSNKAIITLEVQFGASPKTKYIF